MVQNHYKFLGDNRGDWRAVVNDSYVAVFGRSATDDELGFWLPQRVSSFHSLVAAHRAWVAANPKPTVAVADARLASGQLVVRPADAGLLSAVSASRLIGPDGGSLISDDGSTLIGMDGGSLISDDGSTLIGMDGGSLISDDGSTLIGMDGGSLIGMDGGSLIGMDGGSLIGMDGGSLIGMDGASLRNR
jgi:hypothetical protein